jgi:hypothetical protein
MNLLEAIQKYRWWQVEVGSLDWDTLMHYFWDACDSYVKDRMFEDGFDTDQVADAEWTDVWYKYQKMFFDYYLISMVC